MAKKQKNSSNSRSNGNGKPAESTEKVQPALNIKSLVVLNTLLSTLTTFHNAAKHNEALQLSTRILTALELSPPPDQDVAHLKAVKLLLVRAKEVSLIELKKFGTISPPNKEEGEVEFTPLAVAYSLYRNREFAKCVKFVDASMVTQSSLSRDDRTGLNHLKAQALYLSHEYDAARVEYEKGAKVWFNETDPEVLTNYSASIIQSANDNNNISTSSNPKFEKVFAKENDNWELGFNLSLEAYKNNDALQCASLLGRVEQNAKEVLKAEGLSGRDIEEELRGVKGMVASCDYLGGEFEKAKSNFKRGLKNCGDSSLRLIFQNNLKVAGGEGDFTDPHSSESVRMLPEQVFGLKTNKFLQLLSEGEFKDADLILESMTTTTTTTTHLRAALLLKQNMVEECMELLISEGNDCQSALMRAQILIDMNDFQGAIKIIESIAQIKNFPAQVATLVALYNKNNQAEEANALLNSANGGLDPLTRARLLTAKGQREFISGKYELSSSMFREALEIIQDEEGVKAEKAIITCWLVKSLSFIEIDEAENLENQIPVAEESGGGKRGASAEMLENMDIPVFSRKNRLGSAFQNDAGGVQAGAEGAEKVAEEDLNKAVAAVSIDGKGKKKWVRDLVKEKARKEMKRLSYLAKLESIGKYNPNNAQKPDPERWLPKNQRSSNKRKKKGAKYTGAQGSGGGAMKDADKLDAAKRAADKKDGKTIKDGFNSTAHIAVGEKKSKGRFKIRK